MIEEILVEFISAMKQQNLILDAVAELSTQKQQMIIRDQIQDLEDLMPQENKLVADLDKLENVRFDLQKKLQSAWEIDTVDRILEKARADYPDLYNGLDKVVQDLSHSLKRLKFINDHNDELIQQSLEYIANMRFILTGGTAGTYTDKGQGTEEEVMPRPVKLVDKRV